MGMMDFNDSALQPHVLSVTPFNNGGGSYGGNGIAQSLLNNFSSSSNQARQDSLKQYKALLASVAGTRASVTGELDQLGKGGMDRINQNNQQQMGAATQSAYGRGLGNTTILDSLHQGVNRNTQMATNDLQSQIAGQKVNSDMALGQMQGDAILSRQNQGPDMSMILQLLQSLGQNGGGGAGGISAPAANRGFGNVTKLFG